MLFLIRMVVMVIDVLAIGYGDVFTYYVIKDGEGGGGGGGYTNVMAITVNMAIC